MQNQLKVSFENMGASSYLTVTFPKEVQVIGYQMEMISSNQISHILEVSKRMVNGNMVAYYNISSRIKLSQILERRKLNRAELLCLIQGAVKAVQEGEEYQLSEDCFVMDPEYIYVVPDTCSPAFLYIPAAGQKTGGIKELLIDLIMHGRIEMSSDNFIQVLLEALNQTGFSMEKLSACIEPYQRSEGRAEHFASSVSQISPGQAAGSGITRGSGMGEEVKTSVLSEPSVSQPPKIETADENSKKTKLPAAGKRADKPKPEKGRKVKKKGSNSSEMDQKAVQDQESDFDREKAKKKFLLPQAVIMVALAAIGSFGGFMDGNGQIAVNNILAAVVILAVTEVILYREAYVNSKGKGTGKKEKKGKTSLAGKKMPSVPGKKDFMEREPVKAQTVPPTPIIPEQVPVQPVSPMANRNPVEPNFTGPDRMVQPLFNAGMDETEVSSETELWEGDQEGAAYLEYYINGIMNRIPLTKSSTLIGRLASQVDYAVTNPKVGKIHAEFINQNGVVSVVDQNSKNGTYINRSGQRINSNLPYPLKDGDSISLADSEFVLRYGFR